MTATMEQKKTQQQQYRQRLFIAYTESNDASSTIQGWALYDGFGDYQAEASDMTPDWLGCEETHDSAVEDKPPYQSVLGAMRDGWRIIRVPMIESGRRDNNYDMGALPHEWVLEQWLPFNSRN